MVLYAGIDLHSNNNVVVVQDRDDNVVGRQRLPNDPFMPTIPVAASIQPSCPPTERYRGL